MGIPIVGLKSHVDVDVDEQGWKSRNHSRGIPRTSDN